MSKKLFIPLLAVVALAVTPAVSQAVGPNYYSGGLSPVAKITEGESIAAVSWGTLALTNLTTGGKVECHNVIGGTLENPSGGGPGVGQTQSFNPYNCESAACTPAATKSGPATYLEIEAETIPTKFPETGNGTNLRWPSHLFFEGALVRSESEHVAVNVICHVNTGFNGKGEPEFGVNVAEVSEGSNKPSLVTKCCKASSPPEVEFDAGSGTLHHQPPKEAEKGKTEGSLKVLGYNEEEVINAK